MHFVQSIMGHNAPSPVPLNPEFILVSVRLDCPDVFGGYVTNDAVSQCGLCNIMF